MEISGQAAGFLRMLRNSLRSMEPLPSASQTSKIWETVFSTSWEMGEGGERGGRKEREGSRRRFRVRVRGSKTVKERKESSRKTRKTRKTLKTHPRELLRQLLRVDLRRRLLRLHEFRLPRDPRPSRPLRVDGRCVEGPDDGLDEEGYFGLVEGVGTVDVED